MLKDFTELFTLFCKKTGIKESLATEILFWVLLTAFLITFVSSVFKAIKRLIVLYNRRQLNKDLHPFYTPSDVYKSTRYYISTRYQNVSPSEDDEPGRRYIATAKDKLIPLFLNKVFRVGKSDNKYYLVLADSGMGKTTFMVNLFIKYKNNFRQIFKFHKYDIQLFPIWHQDAFSYIEKISNPEKTILLLDAFDEDINAQKDYKKRLSEILSKVGRFRFVVLTCRTQFFPSQNDEPHETGYFTAGENGEYYFYKVYLSVFDKQDIKKYISKKISPLWQFNKYRKALKIVEKCPNLLVRPMLLNYINEMLSEPIEYEFSFQIYEALIQRWIQREARKSGIKEKYGNEQNFMQILYAFSERFSLDLYLNREKRNGYYIPKEESLLDGIFTIHGFEGLEKYILSTNESKSKSLLTRNAIGDFKFSHKSILEYFLAKELFSNLKFYSNFVFKGMDMSKRFLEEMIVVLLREQDGEFSFKQEFDDVQRYMNLYELEYYMIKKITYLRINYFSKIPIAFIESFSNLEKLVLYDKNQMSFLYRCYNSVKSYCYQMKEIASAHANSFLENFLLELKKNKLFNISNRLEQLDENDFGTLLFYMRDINNHLKFGTVYGEIHIWIENKHYFSIPNGITTKMANDLIDNIFLLQKKLPKCLIYF